MTAPEKIYQLVETFEQHLSEYKTRKNETELRRQFLDPFFEALGWDVGNTKGYDERRKEVAHELSVEIDGQQKKADYAFRTGADKFDFLVEAKKPSVNIETSVDAAFQLRRYGWSAKLPINILTDFEHLAVYDCRAKPSHKDKVSAGRVVIYHYKDYADKWDELTALFSPDAIRKGALDKFTEGTKGKKGTADVDDDFLMEIERWREALARNIALRNKDEELNEAGLNYAVQMTIDRIVFLRIAEERGMEEYGRLLGLVGEAGLYQELKRVFIEADARYNSGLFHFKSSKQTLRDSKSPGSPRVSHPDSVTPGLHIDDKVLKDIIENLYLPKSPYAFAYISADILGSIYERFLGKVIRLTAGGAAKVEDKPEVRKAGGVYYTPTYIVEYIVKNTVGRLLNANRPEGSLEKSPVGSPAPSGRFMTPAEAAKLKIVDPACGSGSFLLGAYQYLLNWHLDWYVTHDLEKALKRKVILTQDNKTYRLSMDEKKRILLDNIFGVDLDPQAVEVTKLSLLLKVVEDPGQLTLFHEGHILPDLGSNIQCGNSLIGMDYFDGQMELMVNGDEMRRVNPFDWKNAFPAVFAQGGFDAVIGNPPYIRMEEFKSVKTYLRENYLAHEERADFYTYFVENAIKLIRNSGVVGMIISNKFSVAKYGMPLRETLEKNARIFEIADFAGANVFKGATVRTFILFLDKGKNNSKSTRYIPVPKKLEFEQIEKGTLSVSEYADKTAVELLKNQLTSEPWQLIPASHAEFISRLSKDFKNLKDYFGWKPLFGIKTGLNDAFVIDESIKQTLILEQKGSEEIILPFLFGRDVKRYSVQDENRYVIYLHPNKEINDFPAIKLHLEKYKFALSNRAASQKWFELQQPAVNLLSLLAQPKIVYPIIAPEPRFALDNEGFLINDKLFVLPTDSLFLLGLLNSSLANFFFSSICARLEGSGETYYEFRAQFVERFPLCHLDLNKPAERAQHDQMVSLVERMLALTSLLAKTQTPQEREAIVRQIEATDRAIDALVYQLYGLSAEEIAIVEGR